MEVSMKLNYTFDGKVDVNIDFSISEILKVTSEMDRIAGEDNIVSSILRELKPEIVQNLKSSLKVKKSTPTADCWRKY